MPRYLAAAVVVVALAMVVAGCGCTDVGCESRMTIHIGDHGFEAGESFQVEICMDGVCRTEPVVADPIVGQGVTGGVQLFSWPTMDTMTVELDNGGDYASSADISVTITDSTGAVRVSEHLEHVDIVRDQPNGPGCDPICFWIEVSI